jgi:hypothetical protein
MTIIATTILNGRPPDPLATTEDILAMICKGLGSSALPGDRSVRSKGGMDQGVKLWRSRFCSLGSLSGR